MATLAALGLAACQGAPHPSSPQSVDPTTFTAPPTSGLPDWARAGPAKGPPLTRTGGTLTVLSVSALATLDPTEAYFTDVVALESGLLVRSLTQYVVDPHTGSEVLVPDLATDLGRHNADYTRWAFTLRDGIRYENGDLVTPQDVKFGIERSFDRTSFPGGPAYSNEYFLDGDSYQGPYRSRANYRGVFVRGQRLILRMAKPFPDLPYWAAFPAMSPIPQGNTSDPLTYKHHPWATGPYMIEQYTPNESLTLVRNPYWDPGTDPGRHQNVDELDVHLDTPPHLAMRWLLHDTNAGRTTMSMNSLGAADFTRFAAAAPQRIARGTGPCVFSWYPDNRKITDVRVRRALAYAFPYRQYWRALGELPGVTVFPAGNVLPPGVVGRTAYNPIPGHLLWSTDPDRARAMLAAAGRLGFPIRFPYMRDHPASVAATKVIARGLTRAGFRVRPVATTMTAIFPSYTNNADAPVNIRSNGWCGDWPTGGSWFPLVYRTPSDPTGSYVSNLAFFSQPSVDAEMDAIATLPVARQPAAWNALAHRMQTTWFPTVPLGYQGVALPYGSRVHGLSIDLAYGQPTWKDLWLS